MGGADRLVGVVGVMSWWDRERQSLRGRSQTEGGLSLSVEVGREEKVRLVGVVEVTYSLE